MLLLALHCSLVFLLLGALLHILLKKNKLRQNKLTNFLASFQGVVFLTLPSLIAFGRTTPAGSEAFFFLLTGLLTWKAVTKDYEWEGARKNTPVWRLIALLLWAGSGVEWLLLLPWFGVMFFKLGIWTHHAHMALRTLLTYFSFRVLQDCVHFFREYQEPFGSRVLVTALLPVLMLHYWVPGLGKMALGPKWYSWMLENTSHCLIPNAYLHGWLGFLPKRIVEKTARLIRPYDLTLQVIVMILEAGSLFFLVSQVSLTLWFVLIICMHLSIFLLSGLFFWENTVLCIGAALLLSPQLDREMAFLVPLFMIGIFKFKIFVPPFLAWWDSPLCGRVFVEAVLKDQRRVSIPNSQLCPYERKFGICQTMLFLDEKLPYWHLGEIRSHSTFKLIHEAGLDQDKIRTLALTHGKSYFKSPVGSKPWKALAQLVEPDFFQRKQFLPEGLRWLKTPGELWFSHANFKPFDPQIDEIQSVELVFREYRFFEGSIVKLRERLILVFD